MDRTMRIGVDFDDVAVDCYTPLIAFHNVRYGTTLTRDDVRDWRLNDGWGCSHDVAVQRIHEFLDSPAHDKLMPMPGALEALQALQGAGHGLHVVTGRLLVHKKRTLRLAKRRFSRIFTSVNFADQFGDKRRPKSAICKDLDLDVHIEDAPEHAEEVAGAGVQVLLYDSPWNQGLTGPNITRVRSWTEVLWHISALAHAA